MSKFFEALEQAKRDRALRRDAPPERPVSTDPDPVELAEMDGLHWKEVAPAAPRPAESLREEPASVAVTAEPLEGLDEHLVSLVTPAAFEAEQYRALRHIVEQLHNTANLRVFAVSSPGTGDGKTITAANLAGALAQAPDARVLLIDGDLRRPSVGPLFGIDETDGRDLVTAIMDPSIPLSQITRLRPPFNLLVVCAGHAPPSPYGLLKSARFGELLEEARRHYDYVVIDTPPLTSIQDCRLIGQWVDGFLLVVAAHRTPRRLLEEALTTLDQAKVLGIVFNLDDRATASRYTGYHGGYYALQPGSSARNGLMKRILSKASTSIWRDRNGAASDRDRLSRGRQ